MVILVSLKVFYLVTVLTGFAFCLGGPLNYKYNDRYYAVGIVSFGDNSGTCNGNGAYTVIF